MTINTIHTFVHYGLIGSRRYIYIYIYIPLRVGLSQIRARRVCHVAICNCRVPSSAQLHVPQYHNQLRWFPFCISDAWVRGDTDTTLRICIIMGAKIKSWPIGHCVLSFRKCHLLGAKLWLASNILVFSCQFLPILSWSMELYIIFIRPPFKLDYVWVITSKKAT